MKMRQKKRVRVLAFNLFNAAVTTAVVHFSEAPGEIAPLVLIGLNMFTKFVNNKYFNDVGVELPR